MSVLCEIEANSTRGRLVRAAVVLVLLAGGVTMIYPFLIMVSGSMRSNMDESDMALVPEFLFDDAALTARFLESKYGQKIAILNRAHGRQNYSFSQVHIPAMDAGTPQRVKDLAEFFTTQRLPHHWLNLGGMEMLNKIVPRELRQLRRTLSDRYDGDLDAISRDLGAPLESWLHVEVTTPDWLDSSYDTGASPVMRLYGEMLDQVGPADAWHVSISGYFLERMIFPVYGQNAASAYNAAHGTALESYREFRLPRRVPSPANQLLREEWLYFVSEALNSSFVRLEGVDDRVFQQFLRDRYGRIERLNEAWSEVFSRFEAVQLPARKRWLSGMFREDYKAFLATIPPEHYVLIGPEYAWADWLQARYGSLAALNRAHHASYSRFEDAGLPIDELERIYVSEHRLRLRWGFATRNFINVLDELLLQRRAAVNTAVFVVLSVALALLVNPLAAYAMSRFRLPGTYRTLFLLMATVALPPMVAMIPQFIALRELNLLNTFVALLLPGAVNGYLIFLLKGFFDSLPHELYEAASIDGASEWRVFWQFTMMLSTPILAVVGLHAFNQAYLMFLYALIVTPGQDMWIISVWLYQYQQGASTGVVFASVLIASIPTLFVFLLAQRTIMRGIAVPTEK